MLINFFETLLKIIYYIFNIMIIAYSIYYVITGIFTFFNKRHVIRRYRAKHKFAVLIPARNEEKVIAHLINSLKKQNYPKELYDIFVVVNNCTDNTEKIVRQKGVNVIECLNNPNTKGEALKYAFEFFNKNFYDYDAYVVFDADNVVHSNFLTRMNDTLCEGYSVAQGYRDSKNPSDTWISSCYSLFYFIQNYFFNKARMNMGWSSSINGTGFMVSKKVIEKFGFNTKTMTEDIEFAAQCAINNEKIAFVKDAITYDEQPLTFKESWKQRKRWSVGTFQCLYNYFVILMKKAFKCKIPSCFDMALFFMAPFILILYFVDVIIFFLLSMFSPSILGVMALTLQNMLIATAIGYLISILLSVFVVLVEKKSLKKTLKGIFTLVVFMITWVPINIMCLLKKYHNWEPIEHHRAVDIDNVV